MSKYYFERYESAARLLDGAKEEFTRAANAFLAVPTDHNHRRMVDAGLNVQRKQGELEDAVIQYNRYLMENAA